MPVLNVREIGLTNPLVNVLMEVMKILSQKFVLFVQ